MRNKQLKRYLNLALLGFTIGRVTPYLRNAWRRRLLARSLSREYAGKKHGTDAAAR
jgi:hypothetical protein